MIEKIKAASAKAAKDAKQAATDPSVMAQAASLATQAQAQVNEKMADMDDAQVKEATN